MAGTYHSHHKKKTVITMVTEWCSLTYLLCVVYLLFLWMPDTVCISFLRMPTLDKDKKIIHAGYLPFFFKKKLSHCIFCRCNLSWAAARNLVVICHLVLTYYSFSSCPACDSFGNATQNSTLMWAAVSGEGLLLLLYLTLVQTGGDIGCRWRGGSQIETQGLNYMIYFVYHLRKAGSQPCMCMHVNVREAKGIFQAALQMWMFR